MAIEPTCVSLVVPVKASTVWLLDLVQDDGELVAFWTTDDGDLLMRVQIGEA